MVEWAIAASAKTIAPLRCTLPLTSGNRPLDTPKKGLGAFVPTTVTILTVALIPPKQGR